MYDDNNSKYYDRVREEDYQWIRMQMDFEWLIDEHNREREGRQVPRNLDFILD